MARHLFAKYRFLVFSYALALAVVLSACGTNIVADDSGKTTVDYNQYISVSGRIAWADETCYYLENGHIYVLDSALSQSVSRLCTQADCNHSEESCADYVNTVNIFAWEEDLYFITFAEDNGRLSLYRMNETGEDCTKLAELLSEPLVGQDACNHAYNAGGGHLVLRMDCVKEDTHKPFVKIWLFSLSNLDEAPILLYSDETLEHSTVASIEGIFEDWVFYVVGQNSLLQLYGYHVSTGETILFLDDWEYGFDKLALQEEILYYFDSSKGSLNQMDLNSHEVTLLNGKLPVAKYPYGSFSESYFFQYALDMKTVALDEQELIIYDLAGRECQHLILGSSGLKVPIAYAISTPDYILFHASNHFTESVAPICYIEKAALLDGNAELILLE